MQEEVHKTVTKDGLTSKEWELERKQEGIKDLYNVVHRGWHYGNLNTDLEIMISVITLVTA